MMSYNDEVMLGEEWSWARPELSATHASFTLKNLDETAAVACVCVLVTYARRYLNQHPLSARDR